MPLPCRLPLFVAWVQMHTEPTNCIKQNSSPMTKAHPLSSAFGTRQDICFATLLVETANSKHVTFLRERERKLEVFAFADAPLHTIL